MAKFYIVKAEKDAEGNAVVNAGFATLEEAVAKIQAGDMLLKGKAYHVKMSVKAVEKQTRKPRKKADAPADAATSADAAPAPTAADAATPITERKRKTA